MTLCEKLVGALTGAGLPLLWACETGEFRLADSATTEQQAQAEEIACAVLAAWTPDAIAWEQVRADRNTRLSACDWTQLGDAPLTYEQVMAWAAYRQALRDLPQTCDDPGAVVWPDAP